MRTKLCVVALVAALSACASPSDRCESDGYVRGSALHQQCVAMRNQMMMQAVQMSQPGLYQLGQQINPPRQPIGQTRPLITSCTPGYGGALNCRQW